MSRRWQMSCARPPRSAEALKCATTAWVTRVVPAHGVTETQAMLIAHARQVVLLPTLLLTAGLGFFAPQTPLARADAPVKEYAYIRCNPGLERLEPTTVTVRVGGTVTWVRQCAIGKYQV